MNDRAEWLTAMCPVGDQVCAEGMDRFKDRCQDRLLKWMEWFPSLYWFSMLPFLPLLSLYMDTFLRSSSSQITELNDMISLSLFSHYVSLSPSFPSLSLSFVFSSSAWRFLNLHQESLQSLLEWFHSLSFVCMFPYHPHSFHLLLKFICN